MYYIFNLEDSIWSCFLIWLYHTSRLCKLIWGHCSIYNKNSTSRIFSFRKLYMQLDEGSLTFNANPDEVSEEFEHL